MNQQQLDQIKARALAALPDDGPPNMDKVRAMAEFRRYAANDMLELVAEVERLRDAISLSGVADTMAKFVAEIEQLESEVKRLQAEVERLTPKPRRQLTPEEIQERIDDNFFDEEYD